MTEEEIELAQSLIDSTLPGTYGVEEIYADIWGATESPTAFGVRFRRVVLEGRLIGIEAREANKQNHQMYRVMEG
jgi:hypothetical protein